MYVRLAFAVAAHLEPEILLVDEVLAVGDINFQKKCLGKMGDVARAGRTVDTRQPSTQPDSPPLPPGGLGGCWRDPPDRPGLGSSERIRSRYERR